jgi:hypothetical protein
LVDGWGRPVPDATVYFNAYKTASQDPPKLLYSSDKTTGPDGTARFTVKYNLDDESDYIALGASAQEREINASLEGHWLKIKIIQRQEFVIGGYTPGAGSRATTLGAILVGVYDRRPGLRQPQALLYAGGVGTGFTQASAEGVLRRLAPLRIDKSPFAQGKVRPDAIYVQPTLLAEVEFTEWTAQGILRHPSFKGLREDKDPRDVVREI